MRAERDDGAAERGAGPAGAGRGHAREDDVANEHGRAGHDPFRVRVHLSAPTQLPGSGVYSQHVWEFEVADDERIARERRTRAHDVSGDSRVVRPRMRPDHLPRVGVELPEHAAKVAEVARSASHRGRRGDVARRRGCPLHREAAGIGRADRAFERLIPAVARVVTDHPPAESAAAVRERAGCARGPREQGHKECDCREMSPRVARLVMNRSGHDDCLSDC